MSAATKHTAGKVDPRITSDDLRSERVWLLQHGKQDLMDNGMSSMEANNAVEKQFLELSDMIDKAEGRK